MVTGLPCTSLASHQAGLLHAYHPASEQTFAPADQVPACLSTFLGVLLPSLKKAFLNFLGF